MAPPIQNEKPRLVAAYSGSLANERTPARNDPVFAAYLARIKENFKKFEDSGAAAIFKPGETQSNFNRYAVARADGLWLLFNPKKEEVRKNLSEVPVGKFVAVDIPKGMWSMGEGKVLLGMAPIGLTDLHVGIVADLMYAIASERGTAPEKIDERLHRGWFSLGDGMKVEVIGAGAIEYKYRQDGTMLEIFIDPRLESTKFEPVPQIALTEIIARVNGCEGVKIVHRCL